jgi:hypothetical protein
MGNTIQAKVNPPDKIEKPNPNLMEKKAFDTKLKPKWIR